ncbi:hypothetical protein [Aurantiacibacter aquimixticola]|uniref:DUF481 domain-containing protein n=1 Tax=Aurantiacibacter aquimixticola TaxID=1958945 RepID=A0A419RUD4_9SPHN|nr:hypothetical protein [Aurantiacibacter aquimixticola]RJY09398.1 hypothetical protein D6201_08555 [Aurantiacibacter aquimixticola]
MNGAAIISAMSRKLAPAIAVLALFGAPAAAQDALEVDPYARLETGIVLSESADREDDLIINGNGGYLRGQIGMDFDLADTKLRLEADRIEVQRFDSATGRGSFNRDRLTAAISHEIGEDWEVELGGRIYDDLVTVEAADTDERQVSLQVEYEPVRAHRFQLRGTWRDREYDDGEGVDGASSTGDGPRVDAGYRLRIGRYHYVNVDLRAEEIGSANPRRAYTRESVSASYTRPITSTLRVRPAAELRHSRFDGRMTDALEAREDTQFVPEVELLWWPGRWRVEAEAKYLFSSSNDALREREGYRFSLSVGYVF